MKKKQIMIKYLFLEMSCHLLLRMKKLIFHLVFLIIGMVGFKSQVSVSATAGTLGPTSYNTLKGGFDAVNAGVHRGSVTITISGNTTETAIAKLNASGTGSASYTNLTVRPSINTSPTISGSISNSPIIQLNGSNNVTIDGSNNGTDSRNLNITNLSSTSSNVIVIGSVGTTAINNITLKNCILSNGTNTSTALLVGDGAVIGSPGYFSNITLQNNDIRKAYIGIYIYAVVSSLNNNVTVNKNILNSQDADAISLVGIYAQGVNGLNISYNNIGYFESTSEEYDRAIWLATATKNATISNNSISNLSYTGTRSYAPIGINISSGITNSNIIVNNNLVDNLYSSGTGTTKGIFSYSAMSGVSYYNNKISNIKNTNTVGYGAGGIVLAHTITTAATKVYNNFIWDVSGYGYNGYSSTNNGNGIVVDDGGGYDIDHNTVSLTINQTNSGSSRSSCLLVSANVTASGTVNLRNNIFANFQTVGGVGSRLAISNLATSGSAVFGAINGNDYYAVSGNLSSTGTSASITNNINQLRTSLGGNVNSVNINPSIKNATNLHLSQALAQLQTTPLGGITADIDGETRSTTAPYMGADEYSLIFSPDANNILYVNTAVVGGTGDGSSWANAIKELSEALKWANTNKANFTTTPLQIWVAKGTYKPIYRPDTFAGPNITDRNNSFLMVNNVKLYGGFAGTETTLAQRNLGNTANATILSGDYNNNDVVTGTGASLAITGNGENVVHVVISTGAVGVAELNGFVVKRGNADGAIPQITVNAYTTYSVIGGGVFINKSSPKIQDCIFKENRALNAGGAMSLYASSSKVTNSLFVNNRSTNFSFGGGAIVNSSSHGLSNPYFINCTITGNRGTKGGAMYNEQFPQPKIYNTIIYGNSSGINNTTGNDIQNSLIQGISTTTNGNIDGSTDPLFTNASARDYRLQATSPVIDKGSNNLYTTNGGNLITDKDLAGNNRLSECTIDMGAYEYQNPNIYVNWDGSSWSNTAGPDQNKGACINNNYNLTNSFVAKNLKVLNGVLNIKPNSTVTVYGNITQSSDNQIVMESDANMIQLDNNAANSSHKITVKRDVHMRKMDYTYWGTPVSNQKLLNTAANDGFSVGTPNDRIFYYNEPNDYFLPVTDQYFVPGKGYAIRGKDTFDPDNLTAQTYLFTGGINNGALTGSVQKSKNTVVGTTEYDHGYNLIGNPYPSNIDFNQFYNLATNKNKIFGKVWFWTNVAPRLNQSGSGYNGNNYATLTLTGGTPPTTTQPNSGLTPTQFIKVGQGFIVQVRDVMSTGSPTVNYQLDFDNSIRTDEAGRFYNAKNAAGKDRFWIELVSPQQYTNTVLVGYIPGAENGYDGDYDAELMGDADDMIYMMQNAGKMQIEGRSYPLSVEDRVPLGIKTSEDGLYRIQLRNPEGIFSATQQVYLKDRLLNKTVSLSENAYEYQRLAGKEEGRFEIVYKPQDYLSTEQDSLHHLLVYRDTTDFVVRSRDQLDRVQLLDMSGRLLAERNAKSSEVRISHQNLVNGAYILRIYKNGQVMNKKIIK